LWRFLICGIDRKKKTTTSTIVKTVFEEKTFFAKKGNENGTRTPYFFSRASACCSF
jgi:hypothetical protein